MENEKQPIQKKKKKRKKKKKEEKNCMAVYINSPLLTFFFISFFFLFLFSCCLCLHSLFFSLSWPRQKKVEANGTRETRNAQEEYNTLPLSPENMSTPIRCCRHNSGSGVLKVIRSNNNNAFFRLLKVELRGFPDFILTRISNLTFLFFLFFFYFRPDFLSTLSQTWPMPRGE